MSSILSIGTVNTKTGHSKYFNIFETWPESTAEVWQKWDGKQVLVFTAGRSSRKEGEVESFHSDSTLRFLFSAKFVRAIPVAELKGAVPNMTGYTYK